MIHVAIAAILDGDRVLISKRPPGVFLGGMWELPGGRIEPGETPEQAVRREVLEEVGVELTHAVPLAFSHHRYPDRDVLLLFFRCAAATPPDRSPEGLEMRWVPVAKLSGLPLPPANGPVIEALTRLLATRDQEPLP